MRPTRPLSPHAGKGLTSRLDQAASQAEDQRVLCVWLRAALALPAAEIATALGRSTGAVYNWHSRDLHEGSCALLGSNHGGRRRALWRGEEEQAFLQTVTAAAEQGGMSAAVSPPDGALVSLVLPAVNTALMSLFWAEVSERYREEFIWFVFDRAGWPVAGDFIVPVNLRLYPLPARRPELNPAEHLGEELREKGLSNRWFDSQDAVDRPIERGLATLEKDPERVASLAGFHWITHIPLLIA